MFQWVVAFCLICAPMVVRAQEVADGAAEGAEAAQEAVTQEASLSLAERFDAAFGTYINGPIASVLFFDLYPGDEVLPRDESAVGVRVDGREVVAVSAEGFSLRSVRDVSADEALPMRDAPTQEATSPVVWGYASRIADRMPYTVAVAPGGPLTDEATVQTALELNPGQDPDADELSYTLNGAAPMPLTVVRTRTMDGDEPTDAFTYTVQAAERAAPDQEPALEVGGTILTLDGPAVIASIEDGTVKAYLGEAELVAGDLDNPNMVTLPLVVVWLILGAIFFTFRMSFINIRGFKHAILVAAGRYDSEDEEGEITHFQALSSALSATVGLGNIAGVAVAVGVGGPGAIFWMIVAGFLGMSSKFAECTLGQMYRVVDGNGQVSGGPMRYLHAGLADMEMGRMGRVLAVVFAVMCIGGSLGGGNMFQANQSYEQVAKVVPMFAPKAEGQVVFTRARAEREVAVQAGTEVRAGDVRFLTLDDVVLPVGASASIAVAVQALTSGLDGNVLAGAINTVDLVGISAVSNQAATNGGAEPRAWLYGLILAALVGLVIVGGIKSIGRVAEIIVPFMCGVYVLAALFILISHWTEIPNAISVIVGGAFSPEAGYGGFLGVLIQGFRRAAFSNEAGVGSASIAHSAATTNEPVREGIVALLEPFIDTIVVCTMTGLVVVITGAYQSGVGDGVLMTSHAFGSVIDWFPLLLSFAVVLFAFSTMISWSYYGERCWTYLFGEGSSMVYKAIFLVFVVFGSVMNLGNVLDFSDLMILGMAFPNVLGVALLSGKVRRALDEYVGTYMTPDAS